MKRLFSDYQLSHRKWDFLSREGTKEQQCACQLAQHPPAGAQGNLTQDLCEGSPPGTKSDHRVTELHRMGEL